MKGYDHPVGALRTLGRASPVKVHISFQKILWKVDFVERAIGVAHRVQPGLLCIVVSERTTAGNGKAPYQRVLTSLGLWWADPTDLYELPRT